MHHLIFIYHTDLFLAVLSVVYEPLSGYALPSIKYSG